MSRVFREIDLCAKRPLASNDSRIEYMSRVVCALFVKGMPKIKTPGFWKLSIGFNDPQNSANNKTLLGVLLVNRDFPVDEFLSWDSGEQQDFMLDFVSETVKQVFSSNGVQTSFIEAAREYVHNNHFVNVFKGKGTLSPYENIEARVVCEQTMSEARIYIEMGRGKKVKRYLVDRCNPDEYHIRVYFGRIDWSSPTSLVLNVLTGRKVEVDLSSENLTLN